MVVDRVQQARPHHGVVGAEGGEAFTCRERGMKLGIKAPEPGLGREKELMCVGMRMPAIYEPLTPVSQSELSLGYRRTFKIERPDEAEMAPRAGLEHQDWLQHPKFTQCAVPRHWVRPSVCRHGLAAQEQPGA